MVRDLLIFISILFTDQITKKIIISLLPLNSHSVNILWHIIKLHHVENDGIAFGITLFNPLIYRIISVLTAFIVIIFYFLTPAANKSKRLAIALIAGGAFGNLVDRIAYGKVTDFILIGYKNVNWPVLNIADIAITAGIAYYLYFFYKMQENNLIPNKSPANYELKKEQN